MRELVIGLDIGTTSVKAVVFETKGAIVAEAEEYIETIHPKSGWSEQKPEAIEQAAVLSLAKAVQKADILEGEWTSVGISAAMHSLICLDESGNPLSNAIIWSDGRASDEAEGLRKNGGDQVYQNTGTPIHPMTPLTKLMWMKNTGYEPYEQAASFVSIKEYITRKWFGETYIDYAMASATGMFNIHSFEWDDKALELAGIDRSRLGTISGPETVLRGMDEAKALAAGIPKDLPFVLGAADGQLANLGEGAIEPGEAAVSAGTSGAIRQFMKGTRVSKDMSTFSYAFSKDLSIVGGPTNNGGIVIQWLKDLFKFEGSHEEFLALAEEAEPGAQGLLFFPYINGERAPLWDQRAKGSFSGVQLEHKQPEFVRAVLEGITFNLYQIGRSLDEAAGETTKICVNGGLARSKIWVQILADVFGRDIHLSESHHGAAWGAAWTALVATGRASSYEEIKNYLPKSEIVPANEERHRQYKKIYARYEKIGRDIVNHF